MQKIQLTQFTARFGESFELSSIDWCLQPGQHWLICGANGSGKSALAAALCGAGERLSGSIEGLPARAELLSYELQRELIERERRKDDADILDVMVQPTRAAEILQADAASYPAFDDKLMDSLIDAFALRPLLARAFRSLSTGETRKLLLLRALARRPELLVLDEPFDGLDAQTREQLARHLAALAGQLRLVLVLNRFDEMPAFISHIAYVEHGRLHHCVRRDDAQSYRELYQLLHLKSTALELPDAPAGIGPPPLPPGEPLVQMRQARIAYGEQEIFSGLDWRIEAGQHWQLSGPNGSGKTCLLNLITGDHPQCYRNDIRVFGMQRGSGESIWQIKQYIGYVSSHLQWEYRVGINLRNVLLSGFYDSIGLYQRPTVEQRQLAERWLALLGMAGRGNDAFQQMSYGEQRLLLIARAMVKHPPLLILDEPCLGLDDMNRSLVLALVERICAGSETTVIYVNHHAQDRIAGIEHHLALPGRDQ